nr:MULTISPECIES: PQQ-binding-like beta-propeller repeat protein [unclassified Bradyrhizobium]
MFVPTIDWGTTLKLAAPDTLKHEPPKPFIGSANGFGEQDPERFGHITAVDADSGNVVWKYDTDTPVVAALTPTAGGVLLTGATHRNSNFLAFDAATGELLLKRNLGDPIGGGIMTYMIGGTQYVAVAAE